MAFPGIIRWTAKNCGRVCNRNCISLNGFLQSQRSFGFARFSGIKYLVNSSSQGHSGYRLMLLRSSVGKLQNSRSYSSKIGDDKTASASADDNYDPSDLDTDEPCTLYLSDEDLDTLTEGDPEILKKVRHIQLEHEIFRQEGMQVPSEPISLIRWEELLNKTSVSQRKKYYVFLFKLEHSKRNEEVKKKIRREEREEYLNSLPEMPALGEDEDGMIYGLNRNTLFLRLRESTEYNFYHNRVLQAMKFGPPIVIDCGYDHCMTSKENKYCSNQIELSYSVNRTHPSPFDLHLCNLQHDTHLEKFLTRRIPTLYDPANPLHVTNNSYLDVFPKERLVYLTPHTREDLVEFDEDDIYIIGGIVDLGDSRPFSLAKAKKEGLRMKRLPIDQYIQWGHGGKSLTLDQMIKIMLDVKYYKNWNLAFKHVPRRKLFNPYGDEEETDNVDSDPAPRKHVHAPTFITRTGPKTIYYSDDGQDLRRSHNVNRVNVIEAPLPTDRDRYQRPERTLYNRKSISSNFSRNNQTNFEQGNENSERYYERKPENSNYDQNDELQYSRVREFNTSGFSNPKRSSNSRKPGKVNLRDVLEDKS